MNIKKVVISCLSLAIDKSEGFSTERYASFQLFSCSRTIINLSGSARILPMHRKQFYGVMILVGRTSRKILSVSAAYSRRIVSLVWVLVCLLCLKYTPEGTA